MKNLDPPLENQFLTLRVTANDVFWSLRTGQENPALLALQRVTRTSWTLKDGEAHEAVAPFRACFLPKVELGDTPWERAEELGRREWHIELRVSAPRS